MQESYKSFHIPDPVPSYRKLFLLRSVPRISARPQEADISLGTGISLPVNLFSYIPFPWQLPEW